MFQQVLAGARQIAQPLGLLVGHPDGQVIELAVDQALHEALGIEPIGFGPVPGLQEPAGLESVHHQSLQAQGFQLAREEQGHAADFQRDALGPRHGGEHLGNFVGGHLIRPAGHLARRVVDPGHHRLVSVHVEPDVSHFRSAPFRQKFVQQRYFRRRR